jgi:uncharacterized protein YegP (UPF0339 family)
MVPFEVKQAKDGRFYYRFKGENGEHMFRGQMYPTRGKANRGRDDARKAVLEDSKK